MRPITSFPSLLTGAVLGIALVLACSGDDQGNIDAADAADAATCDCPAAEPPLAGRIVVRTRMEDVPAGAQGIVGAGCNTVQGEQLIGGGCDGGDPDLLLLSSSIEEAGNWECIWVSSDPLPVTVTAQAICLTPAAE